MITDLHVSMQAARDRERLGFAILREWKAQKRWDFTDAELSTEIERRFAEICDRRVATRQLELPLTDCESGLGRQTKLTSCRNTRATRIGIRGRIVDLLQQAGATGQTREELASALGVKEGSVCAAVRHLLAVGDASEPFTRPSRCGQMVAVVVLISHSAEATS